ncbi:UNVERIFIED_CONTAM: hypothetical protein RMT77_003071 [Armadillidium vulgare]
MERSFIIFFVFCIARGLSLSCLPCSEVECEPAGSCPYGIGTDICGCCDTCLKGPGAPCGGVWNYLGDCGDDLECDFEGDFDYIGTQSAGTCVYVEETGSRKKRATRRRGNKLIRAKSHKHIASSGIPKAVLEALRKQRERAG